MSAVYLPDDARAGAQLRAEVGVVLQFLYNPCGGTDALVPAIDRFVALRDGQKAYARRLDFVIARADYDYQMSLVDIACPDWSEEQQREADELNASVADATMDRMDIVLKELAEKGE
ncbi:hypothetical protein [Qipengyuania sp. DGS5-3]|uniref:hypothetical protein n=1 Tax=Qipengyuania sp. DGS5-3 TaxID=3349632 RepID=UPI0036D262C0